MGISKWDVMKVDYVFSARLTQVNTWDPRVERKSFDLEEDKKRWM